MICRALASHARLGEAFLSPEAGGCLRKPGSRFRDWPGADEGTVILGWLPGTKTLSSLWSMGLLRRSNLRREYRSGERLS